MQTASSGDNLHEKSKPIFLETEEKNLRKAYLLGKIKKNIPKGHQLTILPSMLSICTSL